MPYRGGYLREMSALQGWLLERDVCLTGVVTIERCLPYRGGYCREMSTLKGWLLERDLCLTGMVTIERCRL